MLDNGDSTLIVSPKGKTIIVDGGEPEQNILIPYLLARKIKTIDYLIISHFDSDHVGGLLEVMQELKVRKVVISMQNGTNENYDLFKQIVNNKNIKVIFVEKNDTIKIEKDLYFDILWPSIQNKILESELNNNSLVCKMHYKNFTVLFTGDIEEIAEKEILQKYKNNKEILSSTILKVAHHGSKTSSTQELLNAVKPKIALIGVGKNNKFGHPNDEVIERLNHIRTKIYRTDQMGEIEIIVNKKEKIKIKTNCN